MNQAHHSSEKICELVADMGKFYHFFCLKIREMILIKVDIYNPFQGSQFFGELKIPVNLKKHSEKRKYSVHLDNYF